MSILNRTFALAGKTYAYFRAHGVLSTLRRIGHGVAIRLEIVLGQRRMHDGLAPLVVSTLTDGSRGLKALTALEEGATLLQEISTPLEFIYEVELRFSPDAAGGDALIALVCENGTELHRERLDPRRQDSAGRYSLRLKKTIPVPAKGGPLYVIVKALGKGNGRVRPMISPEKSIGTLRMTSAPLDEVLGSGSAIGQGVDAIELDANLGLRIMARSARAFMRYHRPLLPMEFAQNSGAAGTIFVVGGRLPGLQLADGAATAIRLTDAEDFLKAELRPGSDVLLLADLIAPTIARDLVKLAQSRYLPVINAARRPETLDPDSKELNHWHQLTAWSDAVLVQRGGDSSVAPDVGRAILCEGVDGDAMEAAIAAWLPVYHRRILPKVSIVTVLYGKARQLEAVLTSYLGQSYRGELEIVFVDDESPDDSIRLIQDIFDRAAKSKVFSRMPHFRVIHNERNFGNCVSRNIGIANAEGDVIVVIDADCMLNREFVTRHVEAHSYGDCDVVIGPLNIETEHREPLAYLAELEQRAHLVASQAQPQDAVNQLSFVNCITRNFSIRKEFIEEDLFDPHFSYSKDPSSGFGWEDVEMGYRLYRRGARVKYVSDAFSVHISHPASVPEHEKPMRSLKNFRRLVEKHQDISREARRWIVPTYKSIKAWCVFHQHAENEDMRAVERVLGQQAPAIASASGRSRRRPLRVLTYRWHVPHQYELYKLPHKFTLLSDLDTPMTNQWEFKHRPLPDNVSFRSRRNIRFSDFDVALLHFDENVLSFENTNGVLGPDWGAAFRWFMENVDLPKIAICHGTPQFRGQYDMLYDGPDLLQTIEPARDKLVRYLGDTLVVCNSHQAQREWQFRKSRVIWHGFDPTEFPPATYQRGILSPLGPLVLSRPHYRGYFLYKKVFEGFPKEFAPSTLHVPDPSPLYEGNQYAIWKFRNYVDEIRRYSVYFNPTQRSPMPRARGEPMMCGVVTVNANNHDVDMFIQNGINGFYSNDADELRDYLLFLSRNPAAARRIGAAGRRTAIDIFNHDRYLADWQNILKTYA